MRQPAGISEVGSLFAENLAITTLPFNNLSARIQYYRNSFIFKQPSGSSFFSLNLPFVFNNSSGSSVIFNISSVATPVLTSKTARFEQEVEFDHSKGIVNSVPRKFQQAARGGQNLL
jgi:hypothetical protein